jgi:hypothetical protein
MDAETSAVPRDVFIWKIVEQFEGFTRWVVEPYRAMAWDNEGEAMFSVFRLAEDEALLSVRAYFDSDGARAAGFKERLRLEMNWKGLFGPLLVLGWRDTRPDVERGLDSRADHAEGE